MEYSILNNPVLKWWQRHTAWQTWMLASALPLLVTLCWLLSIKLFLPLQLILSLCCIVFFVRLILIKPQVSLFILLFFDFFVYMLSTDYVGLLPSKVVWLSDGIFFLLFFHVLFTAVRTGRWQRTVIDLPLLFFVGVIILSALMNHTEFLPTLLALRFYLKFPFFYLILVNLKFEPQTYQTYKNWFLGLVLLQVPVTIFEYVVLHWRIDDVGGTLGPGGTTQMGLMCLLAQCLCLTYVFEASKQRLKYLIYTVLLLIPAVLGSVNANFLFLMPLLGFICLRKLFTQNASRLLVMVPVLILALLGSLKLYTTLMPENTAALILSRPRAALEVIFSGNLDRSQSINRLVQIPSAVEQALSSPARFLLGQGPYEYAEMSKVVGTESQLRTFRFFSGIASIEITRTLLEIGILGIMALILLLGSIWLLIRRSIKAAVTEDQMLLGRSVELMWVFFILAGAYGLTWQMEHLAIPFWVWVASLSAGPAPPPEGSWASEA